MPRSPKRHATQTTHSAHRTPTITFRNQLECWRGNQKGGLSVFRKCRDTARGQRSHVSASHLQRIYSAVPYVTMRKKGGLQTQRNVLLTPYGPPRARISHPGYLWPSWLRLERDVSEGGGTPNSVRVRIPLGQFWTEVKRQRTTGGWLARTAVQVAARGLHAVGSTHRPLNKLCRGNHFGIPQRSVYSLGQTQRNCVVV